jgi:hypothetical protein
MIPSSLSEGTGLCKPAGKKKNSEMLHTIALLKGWEESRHTLVIVLWTLSLPSTLFDLKWLMMPEPV